ncbi:MAG: bifunctional diaminohydroxyphosphoribosylaminopyrimidine deaminase/5-amino-6-(5-phosphoribosylamino)uracil reductase RibD [Actinobacteria bacterium]|nr:bifunctional diaminohydroxyphosphoribosylaminopyrimidine deaminase/5-amino-6-(5-phosphoribosylamino)uracil reductase RibD [Actinomycetota bacterium]
MTSTDDEKFMQLALHLAQRGRGRVEPNPIVGAVLVRDGCIIGKGYHRRFGGPHAEINALNDCQEPASGATMYVSLEPCCHQGKTPPCTQALITAGLARVVVATKDPSTKVDGQGLLQLRQAQIEVTVGPCAEQAWRLNAPFFKLHRKGRPFVLLKWAQSLDGKIAGSAGESRWISNEESRRFTHQLRRQSQAILVGIGTALADDPLLTPRPAIRSRLPLRIVLDSRLRLPIDSQLVRTAQEAPLLIATTQSAIKKHQDVAKMLTESGVEVYPVCPGPGPIDLNCLLALLGQRRISTLMVEGGSGVLTQFIEQRLADEVHVFICPQVIGGTGAVSPIGGRRYDEVADTLKLANVTTRRFGDDVLVRGDLPGLLDYLYQ